MAAMSVCTYAASSEGMPPRNPTTSTARKARFKARHIRCRTSPRYASVAAAQKAMDRWASKHRSTQAFVYPAGNVQAHSTVTSNGSDFLNVYSWDATTRELTLRTRSIVPGHVKPGDLFDWVSNVSMGPPEPVVIDPTISLRDLDRVPLTRPHSPVAYYSAAAETGTFDDTRLLMTAVVLHGARRMLPVVGLPVTNRVFWRWKAESRSNLCKYVFSRVSRTELERLAKQLIGDADPARRLDLERRVAEAYVGGVALRAESCVDEWLYARETWDKWAFAMWRDAHAQLLHAQPSIPDLADAQRLIDSGHGIRPDCLPPCLRAGLTRRVSDETADREDDNSRVEWLAHSTMASSGLWSRDDASQFGTLSSCLQWDRLKARGCAGCSTMNNHGACPYQGVTQACLRAQVPGLPEEKYRQVGPTPLAVAAHMFTRAADVVDIEDIF